MQLAATTELLVQLDIEKLSVPYGDPTDPPPTGSRERARVRASMSMSMHEYLGGAAVVRPGAPGGGVGLANGVREVLEARSGSRDHVLEELEHFAPTPSTCSPWILRLMFGSSPIASPGGGWSVREEEEEEEASR